MERLTEKLKDTSYCISDIRAIRKECFYEDMECRHGVSLYTGKAIDKLAEYEDLEEQGKLLKLPCAVGDRIYVIDTDERVKNKEIKIYDIDNIVIASDGTILLKHDSHDGVICELENIITDKPYLDFYRCFLSQEEAEAALKGLLTSKQP